MHCALCRPLSADPAESLAGFYCLVVSKHLAAFNLNPNLNVKRSNPEKERDLDACMQTTCALQGRRVTWQTNCVCSARVAMQTNSAQRCRLHRIG